MNELYFLFKDFEMDLNENTTFDESDIHYNDFDDDSDYLDVFHDDDNFDYSVLGMDEGVTWEVNKLHGALADDPLFGHLKRGAIANVNPRWGIKQCDKILKELYREKESLNQGDGYNKSKGKPYMRLYHIFDAFLKSKTFNIFGVQGAIYNLMLSFADYEKLVDKYIRETKKLKKYFENHL